MSKNSSKTNQSEGRSLAPFFKVGGFILLILLFVAFLFNASSQPSELKNEYAIEVYGSVTCAYCREVKEHIENNNLDEKLDIGFLYTSKIDVNKRYLKACEEETGTYTGCGVPLMKDYENNVIVSGSTPIIEYLDKHVAELEPEEDVKGESISSDDTIDKVEKSVSLPLVIGSALADSFNPCAWSAMLFLISSLISVKSSRSKMIKIGSSYILTIFFCYLMIGIGLFAFLEALPTGFEKYIYGTLSAVILIAALIEIKDFFWYGKGISLKIPESQHDTIQKFMSKGTIPATIIVAFLISILEFGCTGGVYLPIIAMLSNRETFLKAFIYLILYNFIFVLPLIVILLLVLNGKSYKLIEEFRQKNRKLMKLISGLVMIGLALWIIFQYLV